MNTEMEQNEPLPDPAGLFACALSLWNECNQQAARDRSLNLSEIFNGMDELMRLGMRIGTLFEGWACRHVIFESVQEVWPYLLDDRFGRACLQTLDLNALPLFNEEDCLRVALKMALPISAASGLPLPVDVSARNPVAGSAFQAFRIQTVRHSGWEVEVIPFLNGDDPFDEDFGPPFFAIYGQTSGGLLDHIADRPSYAEAVELMLKIVPGIQFGT